MPKARVYELAKELGVDSKTVLNKLEAMGEFVKSASSAAEPPVARKLRNAFASNAQSNASESKKPAGPGQEAGRPRGFAHPCASRHSCCSRGIRGKACRSKAGTSCSIQVRSPEARPAGKPRPGDSRQHGHRARR